MNKLLLACLLVFCPVTLASADLKIAVVDLGKAFDQYYKTKDAQARLNDKQEQFKKDYQDLVTDYQNMGQEAEKLQQSVNDPTLSAEARADRSKALDQKKQDLLNMQRKMEETGNERKRELQDELIRRHTEIVAEISKVVNDYAAPLGYDLVIDKSSISAASGAPLIVFCSGKLPDITTDIITKLNANAPPPGTAPAEGAAPSGAAPATAAH